MKRGREREEGREGEGGEVYKPAFCMEQQMVSDYGLNDDKCYKFSTITYSTVTVVEYIRDLKYIRYMFVL